MEIMGQVIFVVARESVEALLVIGILWAWMNRYANTQVGKKWLIGGIIAGLALAVFLAMALMGVATFLGPEAQEWFEIGILVFATILIVQMVWWMRKHGRTLKSELESDLAQSVSTANWWGVFFLAMIAVGREGSETVVFLYGTFLGLQDNAAYQSFAFSALIGLAIAMLLFYALQLGGRFISWRIFFRFTEILLLFLGVSLLLSAEQKLMSGPLAAFDLPSWMYSTVWNTGHILNDSSTFGSLLASLFAYRSQPIGLDIVVFVVYWVLVWMLFSLQKKREYSPAS